MTLAFPVKVTPRATCAPVAHSGHEATGFFRHPITDMGRGYWETRPARCFDGQNLVRCVGFGRGFGGQKGARDQSRRRRLPRVRMRPGTNRPRACVSGAAFRQVHCFGRTPVEGGTPVASPNLPCPPPRRRPAILDQLAAPDPAQCWGVPRTSVQVWSRVSHFYSALRLVFGFIFGGPVPDAMGRSCTL